MGAQIVQKSRSHLKVSAERRVKWNKFRTVGPQMLGSTLQNSVAMATCRSQFVHPSFRTMHYCITRKMCVVRTAVAAFLQAGSVFHSFFVWPPLKAGSHCGSPSSIRSESRMGIGYRDRVFSWFASVPRGKCLVNKSARATATSYRIL